MKVNTLAIMAACALAQTVAGGPIPPPSKVASAANSTIAANSTNTTNTNTTNTNTTAPTPLGEGKELPFLTTLKSSKKLQDSILPKIGSNIDLGKANTMQDLISQLSDTEVARLTSVFDEQDMARLTTSGFNEADLARLASLPAPVPAPASAPAPAPVPAPATFLSTPDSKQEKFVQDSRDFSQAVAGLFDEAATDQEQQLIFDNVLSFLGLEADDVFDPAKVEDALLGKMSEDWGEPKEEKAKGNRWTRTGKNICLYDQKDYKEQLEITKELAEKEEREERDAMEKAKKAKGMKKMA
ncbi:Chitin synthase 2 [Verticillium dahliae VDG2]|nr:Chitin synthase 2 [Verticillium dahliae VDG2]